ncbi:MAG: hypothetical protein Q8S18_09850 [Bacteroidales bacterium]|nr:hypothetical protein [Bacteroidales bacterium]
MKLVKQISLKNVTRKLAFKPGWSKMVILTIAIVITYINFNNHIWLRDKKAIAHDVLAYYSYLPAAFIYQDLTFAFIDENPEFFKDKMYNSKTSDGSRYQKMTMGLAFMFLPFFLAGHASALLFGFEASGYSVPYYFFVVFSSLAWLVLGLFFLRKILLEFFPDWLTAVTMTIVVFATNLLYYTTLEATMPHAYNFALVAVFLWLTISWYRNPTRQKAVLLGLVIGMIVLIRPVNGIIALVFILYGIKSLDDIGLRVRFFIKKIPHLLLITGFSFLVVLPQLIFWKVNTGNWLFYSYGGEGFFFNNPQIIGGLFSYRKGWLIYTPVMIFALIGFLTLKGKLGDFRLPFLVYFPLGFYVIFSWWCWWYGGSFGSRPMVDSYALLAIPLAGFISSAHQRSVWLRRALYLVFIFMMMLNFLQTYQYKKGIVHYDSMSKASYWYSFGKLKVDAAYWDLLEPVDYKLLIEGIYQTVPVRKKTIRGYASTDFESVDKKGTSFMSSDGHYHFNGATFQTSSVSRSGNHSLLLFGEEKYGAGIDFYVRTNEKYRLTVWKHPANANAALTIVSYNASDFTKVLVDPVEIDADGWGKIEIMATLPDTLKEFKFKAFVWNRSLDTVYFDDLKIEYLGRD